MEEVTKYLHQLPPSERAALERIRNVIKELVPQAEESIAYMMPAFKYKNKPLVYYAAFKDHLSIFPTPGPAETLHAKLKEYKTSKGTIQFTLDTPLPDELLKELLLTRVAEIDSKA